MLQRSLATTAWLETVLRAAQARRAKRGDDGEEAEAATPAGDGESSPQALSGVGALPGFVWGNAAGIGGLVADILVLVSVFMP